MNDDEEDIILYFYYVKRRINYVAYSSKRGDVPLEDKIGRSTTGPLKPLFFWGCVCAAEALPVLARYARHI